MVSADLCNGGLTNRDTNKSIAQTWPTRELVDVVDFVVGLAEKAEAVDAAEAVEEDGAEDVDVVLKRVKRIGFQ